MRSRLQPSRAAWRLAAIVAAACILSGAAADSTCGTASQPRVKLVEDSDAATELVRLSAQCAADGLAGYFNVRWNGTVELNDTVTVHRGGTMSVAGVGNDAVIMGGAKVRLFTVGAGAMLHLQNLTLRNGWHTFNNSEGLNETRRIDGGGAVKAFSGSSLTVDNCRFNANTVEGMDYTLGGASGGAIFADNATVFVKNSVFSANYVPADLEDYNATSDNATQFYIDGDFGNPCYGGAIFATNETSLHVEATSFDQNMGTNGAAVAMTYGVRLSVILSSFTGQRGRLPFGGGAAGLGSTKGAGIYVHQPGPGSAISDSNFTANEAAYGASIYFTQRTDEIQRQSIGQGDSAYAQGCPQNVTEEINKAGSSSLDITSCVFRGNVAVGNLYSNSGGILMERGVVELHATDSLFENNTAPTGGVVQLQADTPCYGSDPKKPYENVTAIFTNCTFSRNMATGIGGGAVRGGAVLSTWATIGHVEFRNCSLSDNIACSDCVGGAAKFGSPDVSNSHNDFPVLAYDTTFANNHAGTDGGAFHVLAPTYNFSFSNTTFEGNRANRKGGAIYSAQNASITFIDSRLRNNSAGTLGGALAMEPSAANATLKGKGTTFANNTASISGGALFCDNVELIELDDCGFVDNLSPFGQIALSGSTLNAKNITVTQSGDNQTTSAGILSTASTVRCVYCAFMGFSGSTSVISLSGANSATILDSCRFADAALATLVSSADNEATKTLQVRNAELGENPYIQAGYDASKFTSGDVDVRGCEDSSCIAYCMPADFGVICGSFYDVLDFKNETIRRTTSNGVAAKPHSVESTTNQSSATNFTFIASITQPQFFFTVTAAAELAGGERLHWTLEERPVTVDEIQFDFDWVIVPSMGLLRAGESIDVSVRAGVTDLSGFSASPIPSRFVLYNDEEKPLDNSSQPEYIYTSYSYCRAGDFQTPPQGFGDPSTCSACASNFSSLAVQCSAEHGESLESLPISPGYWRENSTSTAVLKCPNKKACTGGRSQDDCSTGYDGPYCATCADGYTSTGMGYKCVKCTPGRRDAGLAALMLLVAICIVFVAAIWSTDSPVQCEPLGTMLTYVAAGGSSFAGIWSKIPFSKLRIPVVTLQILTQYSIICNVQYPKFYENFLRAISFINLDLAIGFSAICLWPDANFYDRLLVTTLAPLFLISAGGCLVWWWRRRRMRLARRRVFGRSCAAATDASATSTSSMEALGGRVATAQPATNEPKAASVSLPSSLVTIAVPVLFLVYSSCSTATFAAFLCDDDAVFGKSYLRADYSIECSGGKYTFFTVYAAVMIAVYPVGTPILFAWQLHQQFNQKARGAPVRSVSASDAGAAVGAFGAEPPATSRSRSSSILLSVGRARAERKYTEFLWTPYREKRHFYEVVECARRLLMTGVLIFLFEATRPTYGLLFAAAFLVVYAGLKPFQDADDSQSYLTGLGTVWLQVFLSSIVGTEAVASNDSSAKVVASCIIVIVVLTWVMVIWQAVVAARGGVAVVSESLHPLWTSSRRPSFLTSVREGEVLGNVEESKDTLHDSTPHASACGTKAPAWGAV